jgi:uncharacterized protein YbjT (DUF2867 family)
MTTLITGVTGQVGSRFARRVLDRNEPVRLLVRREEQAAPWRDRGGSCGWLSCTARAIPTWPTRCAGPGAGRRTSGCSWRTTPTRARRLSLALRADGVDGRIYNCADDAPVTAWDLHELAGQPMPPGNGQLDDPWFGIVSTRRIRTELGFRPLYPTVWTARDAGAL